MNLKEGYIKIKNAQVNNRIYAKSVTKRRTPISFKVRGSSCQKQREEDQQNLQLNQNYAYMKQDKDNYLQAEINNQNGQKQELCNIQTNGASKKLAVSPIQFDQEEQKDYKTNFSNRFKAHSPNKAIANSFVFKIQHDQVKNQARANLETSFKSNTETLRQNRVKNKVIDSSFLTGKREGNLGYNSTATTTSFANGRIKNSATPIIDVNDVNAIDQKAIQSINPKTLPFLSSDRGINQNNHFHFGEFKISTSKATELFQNNILPKTQKQSGNNSNNNQISQSVTATITYNSKDNNQGNTNKLSNLNRTKNNTICTNQNIIYKHNRYSSNTPSKRVKGVLINSVLSENQSNKETLQASNRNSQIRKRQQIIQKQNNILANSIQHIYSNLEENAGQLSKNRRINNTTNFDSTNFQTNENSEKAKQNQASNPIQQAINKQQFNKIFVNFSKLRREGQDLGKGFLGSILTNAPKHPIYNQISQRQKNSLNVESRIIKKEKDPNQNQHCNEDDLQYPKNSNKALEMVESLVQKINSQLNDLQVNLSIMKSSNKILLDAIEQKESTEIFHQIEKYTDTTTATSSSSSKQISKIQINKLIPLMKQCFDSTYDLSDPSTIAFLQTDNEDSEQEDKNSSRETKNEIKQNYNK